MVKRYNVLISLYENRENRENDKTAKTIIYEEDETVENKNIENQTVEIAMEKR